MVHEAEQPSPSTELPSSQASMPSMAPLPQMRLQLLGVPAHSKPASIWQALEQPSPLLVLVSSHCSSVASMKPSEHTDRVQSWAVPAGVVLVQVPSASTPVSQASPGPSCRRRRR